MVEYRVLSNFWVTNPELTEWVVTNINQAIDIYNITDDMQDINFEEIQYCINNYDETTAEKLIEQYGINMPVSFSWEQIKLNNKTQTVS